MAGETLLGGLFFLAAIALVGLPPLSGFLGKVMILKAAQASVIWPWIWGLILGASLVMTFGFARAGSVLFWASGPVSGPRTPPPLVPVCAVLALLALTVAWTLAAGPATGGLEITAQQALDRPAYIDAVLEPAPRPVAGD